MFVVGRASAGTFFGALSNFDAVNDTGSPCNGFEIELDDTQSKDVAYTFDFQRYGMPKITEDSRIDHPGRWQCPQRLWSDLMSSQLGRQGGSHETDRENLGGY